MKLRTVLKIISFVLLIFSTMTVLRYPSTRLLSSGILDGDAGHLICEVFNSIEVKVVELGLYLLFAFHMHMLDFKFPKAEFGRYFRYDMAVALINYIVITMEYSNVSFGYIAKMAVEMASCFTTFLCGWSLCKTLKNHGMMEVGISYFVLSCNHIVYLIVLIVQFCILMYGPSRDVSQFLTPTWMTTQWFLLMPILFFSRVLLFRGTMKLKVHRHKHDDSMGVEI